MSVASLTGRGSTLSQPASPATVCGGLCTVFVVPFCTPLSVRHEVGEEWRLLDPLVFEGNDDYFVMRKGFKTDFASIPRPVRWLFDTAGTNSEPGVLHDAVWRESKRDDGNLPRVDRGIRHHAGLGRLRRRLCVQM